MSVQPTSVTPVSSGTAPVEPGYTTTEFWQSTLGGAVVVGFGLAETFGAHLPTGAEAAVAAAVPVALSIALGAYAVGRSLRKSLAT